MCRPRRWTSCSGSSVTCREASITCAIAQRECHLEGSDIVQPAVQEFHFELDTGLLRQHDYTADVFGSWAKAAHVVLAQGEAEVPFTADRRVTPRRRDGSSAADRC